VIRRGLVVVLDCDTELLIDEIDLNADISFFRHDLDRVSQQVVDCLLEQKGIGLEELRDRRFEDGDKLLLSALCGYLAEIHGVGDDLAYVNRLQFSLLDLVSLVEPLAQVHYAELDDA
jgi:hypothetical protein